MSAQFTVTALSYCLGKGRIALKGRKRKPWLILRRGETDRTYLDHQLRRLRREHDGPVDAHWDVIEGRGFFDDYQVSLHGEQMDHVYKVLYLRDEYTITRELLEVCGMQGLACMWIDRSSFTASHVDFKGRFSENDTETIAEWLTDIGYRALSYKHYSGTGDSITWRVRIPGDAALQLRKDVYPLIHRSMRPGLRWKSGYRDDAPKKNGVRGAQPRSSDFCRFPELATDPPCV